MGPESSLSRQIAGDMARWLPVGLTPLANGIVRLGTYQTLLGEPAAGWVSASLDCAVILAYAVALPPPPRVGVRAVTWLTCTTLLHFALGALAFGMGAAELLGKYDLSRGEPWLLVNAVIAAAPWCGARLRDRWARRRARLIVLVGPKGSGKSTLGRMLTQRPGVHFLDVEPIARSVLAAMGNVIDERYARRAFAAIRRAVRAIERQHRCIVLETTGASEETPAFLAALRQRHEVRLVRIQARPETCAARIGSRDASRQIPVSADLIREMHARSAALALPWDLELVNDPPMSSEQVLRTFGALLGPGPALRAAT